jgi:hypothetical protein
MMLSKDIPLCQIEAMGSGGPSASSEEQRPARTFAGSLNPADTNILSLMATHYVSKKQKKVICIKCMKMKL